MITAVKSQIDSSFCWHVPYAVSTMVCQLLCGYTQLLIQCTHTLSCYAIAMLSKAAVMIHQKSNYVCLQELLQAGPHGIHTAVANLLEGVEQKKRDGLGRTLSMARLSSRLSNGQSMSMCICAWSLPLIQGCLPNACQLCLSRSTQQRHHRGICQSPTVCPWPSWAGMHFTYQVLEPYTQLGWHAFHLAVAKATHDCC